MKYMGSKNRHSKEILEIILKDRKRDQWYIEPFVGGFNVIDKVEGNRIANDIHYYLIELYKAIQRGWEPPDFVTNEQYDLVRKNKKDFIPEYVGFGCSYSGKWFGGYARGNINKGEPRNYCLESKNNILAQYRGIQGIKIYNIDYTRLLLPLNSIIYCDPPYENTTEYNNKFDYNVFWNWCKCMTLSGRSVFVSSYTAPINWECIWSKEVNNTLVQDTGSKKGTERLFIYKGE